MYGVVWQLGVLPYFPQVLINCAEKCSFPHRIPVKTEEKLLPWYCLCNIFNGVCFLCLTGILNGSDISGSPENTNFFFAQGRRGLLESTLILQLRGQLGQSFWTTITPSDYFFNGGECISLIRVSTNCAYFKLSSQMFSVRDSCWRLAPWQLHCFHILPEDRHLRISWSSWTFQG